MNTKQNDINKIRVSVFLDISDVAKLKMMLRGQTVEGRKFKNRATRQAFRQKTMGDQISEMIHDLVKDLHADADALEWEMYQRQKMIAMRKEADEAVASGMFRKPRSEWLKPGRKPKEDLSKGKEVGKGASKKEPEKTGARNGKKTTKKGRK